MKDRVDPSIPQQAVDIRGIGILIEFIKEFIDRLTVVMLNVFKFLS